MDPEFEKGCEEIRGQLVAGPLSVEEYGEILRVRKSRDYPLAGTPERIIWHRLLCRFHSHYPSTRMRHAWHEAGHIVVGFRLGWDPQSVTMNPGGWPQAHIEPPCLPPALPLLDFAAIKVSGYLAEVKATGEMTDPTEEVSEIAREVRSIERHHGRTATPWDLIRYTQKAEARAREILDDTWDGVAKVAAAALESLPVDRARLLQALKGIEPGERPCSSTSIDHSSQNPLSSG